MQPLDHRSIGCGATPRVILLRGPLSQALADGDPNGEVDHRADEKKRHVEISALLLQNRIGRDDFRAGPHVEVREPEAERHEQQRHDGKRTQRGFERALDHESPGATDQMMDHDDAQATDRHAEPEHVRDQVGAKKLGAIEKGADPTAGERDRADDQRAPP